MNGISEANLCEKGFETFLVLKQFSKSAKTEEKLKKTKKVLFFLGPGQTKLSYFWGLK